MKIIIHVYNLDSNYAYKIASAHGCPWSGSALNAHFLIIITYKLIHLLAE